MLVLNISLLFFSTDLDHRAPKSDKINAIQIWALFCIVMVFFALLEYGLILWIRFGRKYGSIWWILDDSYKGKINRSSISMNRVQGLQENQKKYLND